MVENKSAQRIMSVVSYLILAIFALLCVLPFVMVVSASLSDESALTAMGYGLAPRQFTWDAYKSIMEHPESLLNAYKLTIFVTVVGSAISILVTATAAYTLTRTNYKIRKFVNIYFFITMLFTAGMVPKYIFFTKYLHFTNNLWALILPGLFNVSNVFILRTYFKQVSGSIIEAAKIDGLSEYGICFKIVLPVCKTGVATILLFTVFRYWNSWDECLMYMNDDTKITLQYYLYRIMSNIEQILKNQNIAAADLSRIPKETSRMAMCVLAVGPMVIIFMFFQKYFVKGISVGAVKG